MMDAKEYRDTAHRLAKRHRTPESALKDEITELLVRLPGVDMIRMNTGQASFGGRKVRYGYPGMADIYCRVRCGTRCIPRWATLWIELKAGTKQRDAQLAFEQKVLGWGDWYAVVEDVGDCLKVVEGIRREQCG